MTRVSKIAGMCFIRPSSGGLYVITSDGNVLLCDDGLTDPGVPAVRAIMSLCEVAQQAALDSHRVQESDMSSHDFISDILLGRPVLEPKGGKLPTVVILDQSIPESLVGRMKPIWRYTTGGSLLIMCKAHKLYPDTYGYLTGSYNPTVLSELHACKLNAQQLCRNGLSLVCNYYRLRLTEVELVDLSHVLSFRVSESHSPITTRKGMLARDLSWVETLEGTDVTMLPSLKRHWQEPLSSTSSMFMANFSLMAAGSSI
jgi:hypothetical protein